MEFTFECPHCKHVIRVSHEELATQPETVKCCLCGAAPPPDILTAYQHVGQTMTDLYGCCTCPEERDWLPKEMREGKSK